MISFTKLLSMSAPLHKDTAKNVMIRSMKARKRRSNGNPAIVAVTQSRKANKPGATTPPKYETIVEGMMGEGSKISQRYVSVSCSCDYFLYTCEYALAKKGASHIRYSNGQPPVVKNPQEKPIICKHLVRLMQEIAAKGL